MRLCTNARGAVLLLTVLLIVSPVAAQPPPSTGIATSVIVTVLPKKKSAKLPVIYKEDVFVYEGAERDGVTGWLPLQGNNAAVELMVVIDDGTSGFFGNPIGDLQAFISRLPSSTAVGIGYLRNGTVSIAQDITPDHAAAVKAVRIPAGNRGIPSSPYVALADLMASWPKHPVRRQILFVSDGIDALFRVGANNPYVAQAVAAAQKGNIVIYSIFVRGTGLVSRALLTWGQAYQTQLAEGTGGQAYFIGYGSGPSITAYLEDVAQRMDHQFLLTFLAKPLNTAGPRKIKVRTEVPNADLIAPQQVYVPAAK